VFAREVNESEVMKAALEHVVLVQVDCEKGKGPEIAKTYSVRGYPTFMTVDAEGAVTGGYLGYDGPDSWAAYAMDCAADNRTVAAKKAAYAETPTAALARALAQHASTAYDFKSAVGYFRTARDMDAARAGDYTDSILQFMYYGSFSGDFGLEEIEPEAKSVFFAADTDVADKLDLAYMITGVAKSSGVPERAAPYLREAMAVSADVTDEELLGTREHLAVDAALIVDDDPERAVGLMRANLPEGWQDDHRRLNRFAWWCFENGVNLEEALSLALKGVDLSPDDQARAQILDTAAEICNALGDCSQAVDHMKRAVEMQPDNAGYKDQLVRFETRLADGDCG